MNETLYEYTVPGGGHWSLRLRRGTQLTLTDTDGGANVGMLFYNPDNLLERYNAPDTLKCQHTFKLTQGNCLFSDMGRIFCSIIEDSLGWHDTVCGNLTAAQVEQRWGGRSYQTQRNDWQQNGYDSFLVELAKYGLSDRDMAANLNLFSTVRTDDAGSLSYVANSSKPGERVTLRFEMDTLVILHTCPHPLNHVEEYPRRPVHCAISRALPVAADDSCLTHCPENGRGFDNNRLYYLGLD